MFVPHAGALIMPAAPTAFLNVRQQNWPRLLAYVFGCAVAPAAVRLALLALERPPLADACGAHLQTVRPPADGSTLARPRPT